MEKDSSVPTDPFTDDEIKEATDTICRKMAQTMSYKPVKSAVCSIFCLLDMIMSPDNVAAEEAKEVFAQMLPHFVNKIPGLAERITEHAVRNAIMDSEQSKRSSLN